MSKLRVVGIDFSHMHMGDNLRLVADHLDCELVAVCDESIERMQTAIDEHSLASHQVFTNVDECLSATQPDLAILCPPTGLHADLACRVLAAGVNVMLEKPFAASLADADRMIETSSRTGRLLAINWPMMWIAAHRMTKRLIDAGEIGDVVEVHYYGGNRGPLYHTAHKHTVTADEVARQKPTSWFYSRRHGGGSLLDYLGYGVTFGSWYNGLQSPLSVTCVVDEPAGLEVDEHSVTVVRYARGLSKFETRWGTFTDPWTHQPQPQCGFVVVGTHGTIASYDYQTTVSLQTAQSPAARQVAVEPLANPAADPISYLADCIVGSKQPEGPLSTTVSRAGQLIIDAAVQSAAEKRTVEISVAAG
jgi:glucose-fructose oxidoreductase